MRRIDKNLIKEELNFLIRLEKQTRHKKISRRIQMLIILLQNPEIQLKEVSNYIPVHYKTLLKWWSYYKEGGLERLLEWKVEGYKGKLTPEQEQIFLEE